MPPAELPRKMLPPPMTMATSTCRSRTRLTGGAMVLTVSWSMARPDGRRSASPLSLRSTRRYFGAWAAPDAIAVRLGLARDFAARAGVDHGSLADLEAGEARHHNVLFELGDGLVDELLDLLLVVLGPLLLHQAMLGKERIELALGDLVGYRLLALVFGGGHGDVALALHDRLWHLLACDPSRSGSRDVDGELARQVLEDVVAGDEVRLAVELHQGRDLVVVVHVRAHGALRRGPPGALAGLGNTLLAQPILGLLDVPIGLLQRSPRIQDAGVGGITKLLDQGGRDFGHQASPIILSCTSRPSSTFSNSSSAISGSGLISSSSPSSATTGASTLAMVAAAAGASASSAPVTTGSASSASCSAAWGRAARPSMAASARRALIRRTARMASSLPGMTWSISSGSQFESVMAMIGILSLRASVTAMCSLRGSTTKTAAGSRFISAMPPKLRSRRSRSSSRAAASFLGMWSKPPVSRNSLRSWSRAKRCWMIPKLVSIPPIQRWLT